MKNPFQIIGILSLATSLSAGEVVFHHLASDYLGQPPPAATPEVFARGIVSTEIQSHGAPTFSPDGSEVFWQANHLEGEKKWHVSVMTMRRAGGRWTAPEVSPYASGPVFSPDGRRLYFEDQGDGADPCFVEKQAGRWSAPKRMGLLERFPELKFAASLTIARNGTVYFLAHAPGLGLRNDCGIYRAEFVNGEYARPELLPRSINQPPFLNWTPFIAPDESYLLFSSRRFTPKDDYGDLYVCYRLPDGSWTDRVNLGEPVNSKGLERFPAVSPDGRYLFFTRDTPGYDEDVYWVSVAGIPALRPIPTPSAENSK